MNNRAIEGKAIQGEREGELERTMDEREKARAFSTQMENNVWLAGVGEGK